VGERGVADGACKNALPNAPITERVNGESGGMVGGKKDQEKNG